MQTTIEQTTSHSAKDDTESIENAIADAAHLLPAQGPITAFVHHNTLHAFEDSAFDEAVIDGSKIFGCHPYLPEQRYRQKLARGRFLPEDIEAVLIEDLGDKGDELLGFLGTRHHLRLAMLAHPLLTGPTSELRWVVAETEALNAFRKEAPIAIRDQMIAETHRWIMRDLRNGNDLDANNRPILDRLFTRFDKKMIERWDDSTWESFTLNLLWIVCREGVLHSDLPAPGQTVSIRHRDLLYELTGQDSDRLVHDLLIRFCSAVIDQGFADWELPNREQGAFSAFATLYSQKFGPLDRWLKPLAAELQRILQHGIQPVDSVVESLDALGVDQSSRQDFIIKSLLALRGFAGMIWQLEDRGDRAPRPLSKGSLTDFLAIRLILDRIAVSYLARKSLSYRGSLCDLQRFLLERVPRHHTYGIDQRAFLVFQLAQVIGWKPELLYRLTQPEWNLLIDELEQFSSLHRRRIYHSAFERRYRIQTLDAVLAHNKCIRAEQGSKGQAICKSTFATSPAFQVVCCIDEREESFRRHLEEIVPECETFGAAGFFAVAMNYRGAADAHYTPLCPVIIQPKHYVVENAVYSFQKTDANRRKRRRVVGTVTHRAHIGSRTFAGGWLSAIFGSVASAPLVMRILFPRATAKMRNLFGGFVRPPQVTQLELERTETDPGNAPGRIGYSVSEMAEIVERLLRDVGLTSKYSRIIVICGHGSSSMNNPHEAAHDCGACSGGRGGPNARAFALMANDPRVRHIVAANGLEIPAETIFVGAYHNTCDDSVTYYDLEQLPSTHLSDFEFIKTTLDEARKRDAHERCRRFESADLSLSTEEALVHVEGRAEDLSQVRPEYGHATNALCFVGRREWSRGLFLDRRAFLQSYDPTQDDANNSILNRILQAVIPVCAGINLEYYFSYVDPTGYGCGTKLPHNITSLLGVMNGAASDLRPGLPWQMVEIHEPVRLLFVIESTPEAMQRIIAANLGIANLVRGNWVQLAVFDPETLKIHFYRDENFLPYQPSSEELATANNSLDWYRGWRDHLAFARILSRSENTNE